MTARTTAKQRLPLRRGSRCAFTLLELVAVIALIAVLAAAGIASFRTATFGNYGARVSARQLATDLMQARRRAITEGLNHLIVFQSNGSGITGYTIHRRLTNGTTQEVDSLRELPQPMTVSVVPGNPEFNFEGAALAGYTVTFAAPDRTWQITVAQATGSVSVQEL